MQLTDTANFRTPRYHCSRGQDDIAHVDMEFAHRIVQATIGAAAEQAEVAEGEPATLPEPPADVPEPPACDVKAQDCERGQRCVYALSEEGYVVRCVAEAPEAAPVGEACTRPEGIPGEDTCAPGLFCAFWGLPRTEPQRRVCRRYCLAPEDCADGEVCRGIGSREVGACVPRCDLFDPEGSCPDETSCEPTLSVEWGEAVPACTFVGSAGAGEDCARAFCQPGLTCLTPAHTRGPRCVAFCRDDESCPEGTRCYPDTRPGLPEGFGYCLDEVEE